MICNKAQTKLYLGSNIITELDIYNSCLKTINRFEKLSSKFAIQTEKFNFLFLDKWEENIGGFSIQSEIMKV